MNSAIAEYAKDGCNIIIDCISYKREWLDDLRDKLKDIKTYWVKVNIPYSFVFWDIPYDLEVRSDQETAKAIASRIKDAFKL